MTRRAPKICSHQGCVALVYDGGRHCAEHVKLHRWQGTDTRRTSTAAHKARRARVLRRDGGVCQLGYEGVCVHPATECDHVISIADGGEDTDENCVAACKPCHARKTSLEGHRARGHNVASVSRTPRPVAPTSPASPRSIWIG